MVPNTQDHKPLRSTAVLKERLLAVMEAASALTNLSTGSDAEEFSLSIRSSASEKESHAEAVPGISLNTHPIAAQVILIADQSRATALGRMPKLSVPVPKERHIPEHKKPNAALTFPEKVSAIRNDLCHKLLFHFLEVCLKIRMLNLQKRPI